MRSVRPFVQANPLRPVSELAFSLPLHPSSPRTTPVVTPLILTIPRSPGPSPSPINRVLSPASLLPRVRVIRDRRQAIKRPPRRMVTGTLSRMRTRTVSTTKNNGLHVEEIQKGADPEEVEAAAVRVVLHAGTSRRSRHERPTYIRRKK
jgi:hypothetical protein